MVERVNDAADALGYVVDARARSLKLGRTEQLALSVEDLGNPVYVSMMRAIESVVRAAGFRLLVSSTGSDPHDEIDIIRGLHHGYADGLILSPLRITDEVLAELATMRVPVVIIGGLPAGVQIDNVRANSPRGVRLAVDHLIATRRKAIGFVNGPVDTVPGSARSGGFLRAMKSAGLGVSAAQMASGSDFTYEAGEKAANALLDKFKPDALVCANDLIALGAVRALQARGLDVPNDVAVVGMDDTDLAQLVTPALTSVSLGSEERGRIAATMLLDRLSDPALPAQRSTVQPRLVERTSTAPRRRR